MQLRPAQETPMNRILTCPHCGPTLTEARLRCDRCGRELVYISENQFSGRPLNSDAVAQKPAITRRPWMWAGVSAAAVVVVAVVGLAIPGRQAPAAAPPDAPTLMTARPSAALSVPLAALRRAGEPRPPSAPVAAFRPGDLGQALDHYRAALAEKPADAELLANVGRILVAMNRPAEAVPFLEQAVKAEPFSIVARFDLAVAYGRSGKLTEAVELYDGLVRSGVADIRVHHNHGLALRQLGRNTEAAAAFERATSLAPDRAPGWLGLALSLEADGRRGAAVAALERYLVLEPSVPDADNIRARIARLRSAAEPSAAPADAEGGTSRRNP
jgi:Flp pilus assembly protein TadD